MTSRHRLLCDPLRVSVEGGKYEVVQRASGAMEVLRGGKSWLPEPGAGVPYKLILCMAQEIRQLRALLVTCSKAECMHPNTGAAWRTFAGPGVGCCGGSNVCEARAALGESTWKDLANRA